MGGNMTLTRRLNRAHLSPLEANGLKVASLGDVLTSNGSGGASFQMIPIVAIPVAVPLPTDGQVHTVVSYTVPSLPPGLGRFVVMFAYIYVSTVMTGTGSVVVRLGNTSGGQELLLDATITNATPEDILSGYLIASLGTAMIPGAGYAAKMSSGSNIYLRMTPTGQVLSGQVTAYIFGTLLP